MLQVSPSLTGASRSPPDSWVFMQLLNINSATACWAVLRVQRRRTHFSDQLNKINQGDWLKSAEFLPTAASNISAVVSSGGSPLTRTRARHVPLESWFVSMINNTVAVQIQPAGRDKPFSNNGHLTGHHRSDQLKSITVMWGIPSMGGWDEQFWDLRHICCFLTNEPPSGISSTSGIALWHRHCWGFLSLSWPSSGHILGWMFSWGRWTNLVGSYKIVAFFLTLAGVWKLLSNIFDLIWALMRTPGYPGCVRLTCTDKIKKTHVNDHLHH